MTATAKSPITGDEVEIDITIEVDDEVYMTLVGEIEGETVLELDFTARSEVEEFFRMADKARVAYERQTL